MAKERRRAPRFKIHQMIEVGFGSESFMEAAGLNISESGILCETADFVDPGARIFIRLSITMDNDEKHINCEAVAARSEKSGDRYHTGIAFTDMNDADKSQLARFLGKLEKKG